MLFIRHPKVVQFNNNKPYGLSQVKYQVSSKNYKTQDHFFDISTLHVGYFGGIILTIFIPRHGQTHNLYRGSFRVTI